MKVYGVNPEKHDFEKMENRALDGFLAKKILKWTVHESKLGYFSVNAHDGETLTSDPVLNKRFDEITGEKIPKPKWYDHIESLPYFSFQLEEAMWLLEYIHPDGDEYKLQIEKCIGEGFSGYIATLNNRHVGESGSPARAIAVALAKAYKNA